MEKSLTVTKTSAEDPRVLYREGQKLPDITHLLTVHVLKTVQTVNRLYGPSSLAADICLKASFASVNNPRGSQLPREDYDKSDVISRNPFPTPLPYLADNDALIIPSSLKRFRTNSAVMEDIVNAIRHTTNLSSTSDSICFHAPTTTEIQSWMSRKWPEIYPSETPVSSGWRNSVNQSLCHGQGWNFISYQTTVNGHKVSYHVLFERAFNDSCIIPTGVCKKLNEGNYDAGDQSEASSSSAGSSPSSDIFDDLGWSPTTSIAGSLDFNPLFDTFPASPPDSPRSDMEE
jgi:hypothetical protein